MAHLFRALLLACLAPLFTIALSAQELIVPEQPRLTRQHISAHPSLLFREVTLLQRGGAIYEGYLMGMLDDSIVLSIDGQNQFFPMEDLLEVIIDKPKERSKYGVVGLVTAAYLGNLTFFKAENQPVAYLSSSAYNEGAGAFFGNMAFAGAGLGIGVILLGNRAQGETSFMFSVDPAEQRAQQHDLRQFILKKGEGASSRFSNKRFHLSVQAARVTPRGEEELIRLGYPIIDETFEESNGGGETIEAASDVNLLRKLQLTYSLTSALDIGVAALWFGEPTVATIDFLTTSSSPYLTQLSQSQDARGYFAVAALRPFDAFMSGPLDWIVGGGVGISELTFQRDVVLSPYLTEGDPLSLQERIDKSAITPMFYTEFQYFVDQHVSLSFLFDYIIAPTETLPAVAEVDIPEMPVKFGNSSISINMGLHF